MKKPFNFQLLTFNSKYGPTVFRLGVFVLLAAVIVILFPRYSNAFRYHYEIGKPWGYNTLTADFDFPIYKTDEQMANEQAKLLSTFAPIFQYILKRLSALSRDSPSLT